jgi:hypothetical protein
MSHKLFFKATFLDMNIAAFDRHKNKGPMIAKVLEYGNWND